MIKNKLALPSLLSFERKLEPSDALMYSGLWEDISSADKWSPVTVVPRKNLSTQSAFGIGDEDKTKPNPVAADNDDANLPLEHDTLQVYFSFKVIGNLGQPWATKNPEFGQKIEQKVEDFKQSDMMKELALRYAYNITNGRFLWRNRVGAEQIKIYVEVSGHADTLRFDAYDFSIKDFEDERDNSDLIILRDAILKGLISENDFVLIKVRAFTRLGEGQHIFPSQEMNAGEKKKVLFKLNNNQAAIHNVKIGNALRTVDDWYPEAQFPIAAEPYGSVVQIGEAFRKSKIDLYTLMQNWVNEEQVSEEDKAFVVANLIRGGVFSGEKKKGE